MTNIPRGVALLRDPQLNQNQRIDRITLDQTL
jgi:hypothetical protein